MDRNTITGLVLIGLVLTAFAIFNQPSEEEMKAAKEKAEKEQLKAEKERAAKEKAEKNKQAADTIEMAVNWTPKLDENNEFMKDSTGSFVYVDTLGNDSLIPATSKMIPDSLREKKKELTSNLVEIMNQNQIDSFQTSSGRLVHSSRNTRAPLSKKHLLQSLLTYFKGNEELAGELSKLIMESREIKTVETIQKKK